MSIVSITPMPFSKSVPSFLFLQFSCFNYLHLSHPTPWWRSPFFRNRETLQNAKYGAGRVKKVSICQGEQTPSPSFPSFFWGEVGDPGGGMLTGIILGGLLQIFLVMQFCQEVNHLSLNVAHDFKGWLHP